MVIPNDRLFMRQWGLIKISAHEAWDIEKGNDNVIIGIIDSGMPINKDSTPLNCRKTHIDLQSDRLIPCLDAGDTRAGGPPYDDHGHGTKVLGIVAADTNNEHGIAGMNWNSKVLIYKCLNEKNKGTHKERILAMKFLESMAEHEYKDKHIVVNLSIGCETDSQESFEQIKRMCKKGMIICASVGNEGGPVRFPARHSLAIPGLIAVGMTGKDDYTRKNSCRGKEVTVVAPGEDIYTTSMGSIKGGFIRKYKKDFCGTSAATPFVTGLVSLIWSHNPNLTNFQVVEVIKNTAFKDTSRWNYPNIFYGYGRIDAELALKRSGWAVTLKSPRKLEFADAKPGEIKTMDIEFSVKSFHATTFEITSLCDGFQAPLGTSVSLKKTTDYFTPRYACLRIMYTGTTTADHPSGKVTVRCVETGEEWDIGLSANTIE